jgi:hypothetical protein
VRLLKIGDATPSQVTELSIDHQRRQARLGRIELSLEETNIFACRMKPECAGHIFLRP